MPRKRAPSQPDDWLARLDELCDSGDRRATATLLAAFDAPETSDERRAEIAVTLRALEDPRCAEPLMRTILDLELSAELRSLALDVHSGIPVDVAPRAQALAWARSGDVVIRACGLRLLDAPDGELLAAAASDPAPMVRYAAVDAMASITRTPPLVLATRRAFGDEDAAIREAACRVALFDEPLDTTHELLHALADASTSVRVAACEALEDFPRVSVLLALAEARSRTESGLAADLAFEALVARVRTSLAEASPRARRRVERWAEPVRWLLTEPSRDLLDDAGLGACADLDDAEPEYDPVDVDEAASLLFDADAPAAAQRRILVFRDWRRSGAPGLDVVRECTKSVNWRIRQGAAFALGGLRGVAELVALGSDREPVVRRASFEELRKLDEPRGLAAARETLADSGMRPTAGDDAMALVAEVARPAEAQRVVLAELARPDDRDGLWLGAIHLVRELELGAAEPHLRRIAEGPVTSSVLPHVAALAALRELGLRPPRLDLAHIERLDHLEIQRELGEWDWHGKRYG